MKQIFYLILIVSNIFIQAEEIEQVWQTNFENVQSMFLANDTTLIIHGGENKIYFVNPITGITSDSIDNMLGNKVLFNDISPNGKLLVYGGGVHCIVLDLETKTKIDKVQSESDVIFKNNNELIFFYDGDILTKSIYSTEREALWVDLLTEYPNFKSVISPNGKYALVVTEVDSTHLVDFVNDAKYFGYTTKLDINFNYDFNNENNNEFIGYGENKIKFYNMKYSKLLYHEIELYQGDQVEYACFSEDGNYIAYSKNNRVNIIDPNTMDIKLNVECIACNSFIFKEDYLYVNKISSQYKYRINNLLNVANSTEPSIKVYPNPTNDIIHIRSEQPVNIELYDIYGNKILEEINTKIDMNRLIPGTYYIRYLDQTKMVVKI